MAEVPVAVQKIVDGLNGAILLMNLHDKAQVLWELDMSGFVLPQDQLGLDEDLEEIEKAIAFIEGEFDNISWEV